MDAGRHGEGRPQVTVLERHMAANRGAAVAWIIAQVTPGTTISCDKQMCSALAARGFPAAYLQVLGPTSPLPVGTNLIIETAAVRSLFGASLDAQAAPAVLTTIGSGQAEIAVRATAPNGVPAYWHALAVGHKARQHNEAALLDLGGRIIPSAAARKTIADGDADMRLIVAITDIAVSLPVDIVDFGTDAAKASADLPLRYADLAETDAAAHMSSTAYAAAVRAALAKVPSQYRPLSTSVVSVRGVDVLRITVGAPSPPGFQS